MATVTNMKNINVSVSIIIIIIIINGLNRIEFIYFP